MGIGSSKGAFYHDEFHEEAAPWMIHPKDDIEIKPQGELDTKDQNITTPPEYDFYKELDDSESNPLGPGIPI